MTYRTASFFPRTPVINRTYEEQRFMQLIKSIYNSSADKSTLHNRKKHKTYSYEIVAFQRLELKTNLWN